MDDQQNQELRDEVKRLSDELKSKEKQFTLSTDKIKENDKYTKFYTGLPNWVTFVWLFNLLLPFTHRMRYYGCVDKETDGLRRHMRLSLEDQLLATLMRLKVGLFLTDLSDRFSVSVSHMSRIITTWVFLMEKVLSPLNPPPTIDIINQTLPRQYSKFKNIRFIIDCTELYIETPSNFTAQSLTWSSYKHHNTVKFLVAISPTGFISYVSEAWGGRTSDRTITEKSGFLSLLNKGDLVLADKGFTVGDLINKRGAFLNIPPFLNSVLGQFTVDEVYQTQNIAEVRIHVERAIGRVKQFHILDPNIPLSLKSSLGTIFKVCCYLSNLSEPLVS